jgi:hypothetical protein
MQASDGDESHLPASAHISPAIKRMSALLPWSQEDMRQLPLKDVDAGWSEETAEDSEDASNEANSSNTESESSEDSSSSSSHVFLNRQSALSMFKRSQPLIRTRGVEKQGIVCECCWHSCSLPELAQYCTGPRTTHHPYDARHTHHAGYTRCQEAAQREGRQREGLTGGPGGQEDDETLPVPYSITPKATSQKPLRAGQHTRLSLTPATVLMSRF